MAYVITMDCTACDICRTECPEDAIRESTPIYFIDPRRCTDCGICAEVCPVSACLLEDIYTSAYSEEDYY